MTLCIKPGQTLNITIPFTHSGAATAWDITVPGSGTFSNVSPGGYNLTLVSEISGTSVTLALTVPTNAATGTGPCSITWNDSTGLYTGTNVFNILTACPDFVLGASLGGYGGLTFNSNATIVNGTVVLTGTVTFINGLSNQVCITLSGTYAGVSYSANFSPQCGTTNLYGTSTITYSNVTINLPIWLLITGVDATDGITHTLYVNVGVYTNPNINTNIIPPIPGLLTVNPAIVFNPTVGQIVPSNIDGNASYFPVLLTGDVNESVSTNGVASTSTSFKATVLQIPTPSSPILTGLKAYSQSIYPPQQAFQLLEYLPSGIPPMIPPGGNVFLFWSFTTCNFNGQTSVLVVLCIQQNNAGTITISYNVPSGLTLANLPTSLTLSGTTEQHYAGILSITGSPVFPSVLQATCNSQSANMALVNSAFLSSPPSVSTLPTGVNIPNLLSSAGGGSLGKLRRKWLKK